MTREENLYWIDQEIQTWENECQSKHPIKEALYEARKVLEQEPCKDAVSVTSVFEIMGNLLSIPYDFDRNITEKDVSESMDKIRELPRVTPREPRKGHWIEHPHECGINWEYPMYECSECHGWTEDDSDFCPNCGVDMREVKE